MSNLFINVLVLALAESSDAFLMNGFETLFCLRNFYVLQLYYIRSAGSPCDNGIVCGRRREWKVEEYFYNTQLLLLYLNVEYDILPKFLDFILSRGAIGTRCTGLNIVAERLSGY